MKLMRNTTQNGSCKYAAIRLDKIRALEDMDQLDDALSAMVTLKKLGLMEMGKIGDADEFFLIKLKDRHSQAALIAYANSVFDNDEEFGMDIYALARRSGPGHPLCKDPD
jgi:hypothetical protein